jgi:hypothetical protein
VKKLQSRVNLRSFQKPLKNHEELKDASKLMETEKIKLGL